MRKSNKLMSFILLFLLGTVPNLFAQATLTESVGKMVSIAVFVMFIILLVAFIFAAVQLAFGNTKMVMYALFAAIFAGFSLVILKTAFKTGSGMDMDAIEVSIDGL